MPPKVRRPAAVVAVPWVRGGRPRGLRRPAGAGEPEAEGEVAAEVESASLSLMQCLALKDIEVTAGSYWAAPLKAALRVAEVKMRDGRLTMTAQVLGTQCEDLLKWATGQKDRLVRAHLCPTDCPGTPHEDGLVHILKLRPLGLVREAWMNNMLPEERLPSRVDELAELRADQERVRPKGPREEVDGVELSSETHPAKDKKKKRKRSRSGKKKGGRPKLAPRKELGVVLGSTGADPDPKVRKYFWKKAAKLARRKARGSGGETSGSSSASSSTLSGDRTLFGSSTRVQTIGKKVPGVLVAAALEEASDALVTHEGGVFDTQGGVLPPLFSRYYRQQLAGRMSPAMRREAQTLAFMLDLGLRGRVVEILDMAAQRLKSLEMMMGGAHYTVAQQSELLPKEETTMSSMMEFSEAAKRAREDGKARLEASRPYGSRGTTSTRSDEWGKASGKKGQAKGKGGKSDQKKGEGERADPKKSKGG